MPRTPTGDAMVTVAVKLPRALRDAVKQAAEDSGNSVADFIRGALEAAVTFVAEPSPAVRRDRAIVAEDVVEALGTAVRSTRRSGKRATSARKTENGKPEAGTTAVTRQSHAGPDTSPAAVSSRKADYLGRQK